MALRRQSAAVRLVALTVAVVAIRVVLGRWMEFEGMPAVAYTAGVVLAFALSRESGAALAAFAGLAIGSLYVGYRPLEAAIVGAEVAIGIEVMRRLLLGVLRFDRRLERARDVAGLFAAAVAGASVTSLLLLESARVIHYVPPANRPADWLTLWLSLLLGTLVGTPLTLAFLEPETPAGRGRHPYETWPTAALALAIAGVVFLTPALPGLDATILALVALPLGAWVILRGGRRESLGLVAISVTVAMVGTAHGLGLLGGVASPGVLQGAQSVAAGMVLFALMLGANEAGRRRAIRAVRQREARLRHVIAGSLDGFWELWGTEESGLTHSRNGRRIGEILGLGSGELPTTIEAYQARIHPEDLPRVRAALAEHAESRTPHYAVEYRIRHAAGHYVWVLSRGRVHRRGPTGRPLRAAGTLSDITERKRAELALVAAQDLFDSFMRHAPVAAMIRDTAGRIRYANPALQALVGRPDGRTLVGRLWQEVYPGAEARRMLESDPVVFEHGQPLVAEQSVALPHGESFWLTVKFPLGAPPGERLVGVVGLDITEKRRMERERHALEERLAVAQKLESLGVLAGGIAHDFNNILAAVLGHADLAREGLPAGAPAGHHLEEIAHAAQQAAELTRRMLAYAGHISARWAPLEPGAVVTEVVRLLEAALPAGVKLETESEPDLPPVRGDAALLRQALLNLVTNASEAIAPGPGTIRVSARCRAFAREELLSPWLADEPAPGRYVELAVVDDGCGMDASTLRRMFDPFFSTKFAGRGLGLAAVLGIVRGHGGRVRAESTPGVGTSVRLLLPALPPAAAADAQATVRGAAPAPVREAPEPGATARRPASTPPLEAPEHERAPRPARDAPR